MTLGHHIVSVKTCVTIFSLLLVFTFLTVAAATIDLGVLNFPLAMLIATVKASFVVFYFMGLKFDSTENRVIFFSSFLFVAIFIALTYSDVLFRKGDVYVPREKLSGLKSSKALSISSVFFLFFLSSCYPLETGTNNRNSKEIPKEFEGVGVEEHLGDIIDLDLIFQDHNGETVSLSKYTSEGKPLILIMGYLGCPKLCSLVFNGFSLGAKSLKWSLGKEYQAITVSVNPDEGPDMAKIKQKNYVNHYGRRSAQNGWHFLTGEEKNIKALASQVGFQYKYDPRIEQYAHAAVLIFITPKGKISRYLYGIDFKHNDLKIGLLEASKGKIGTVMEQLLLYCFHYDPDSNSYSFTIFFLMQAAGALTLILLGGYLLRFWLKEAFKKKS